MKICVREDAINANDNFRRQVGTPSRSSALPTGISFTIQARRCYHKVQQSHKNRLYGDLCY